MTDSVRPYRPEDAEAWDELVGRAWNGTFLQTRSFLSYHGDRFRDASWVVEDKQGILKAVFPAAHHPVERGCVVSHPGITFGGLIHEGRLRGSEVIDVFTQIGYEMQAAGVERLRYYAVPQLYHRVPSADDLYAMFRLGAIRHSCTLTSTIPLRNRPRETELRRRRVRRAVARGVSTSEGAHHLADYWEVLEANLRARYGASPVHTLAEISTIHRLFPDRVRCVVALQDQRVTAGLLLFIHPQVTHVQYMASSPAGLDSSAVDLAIRAALELAENEGCHYFDFGTSNEDQGRVLNDTLYWFKMSFGSGSFVHEGYDLLLTGLRRD